MVKDKRKDKRIKVLYKVTQQPSLAMALEMLVGIN
jgi:hypothetical protein